MTSPVQQTPYLRQQRNFPTDSIQALCIELDKSYIDTAIRVNERIIGLFSTGNQIVTGERWYLNGGNKAQQTIRQVYQFASAGNIPHGINIATIAGFTKIYGTFTDGTNFYPLPYVDVTAVNNQVNVVVSPTDIIITAGAGSPPTITSGFVILEWLALF